jgi:predicted component of type VI protein secretion system
MRWLVVAVAVLAAGCGSSDKRADDPIRAEMTKVQTTCAEGVNCAARSLSAVP